MCNLPDLKRLSALRFLYLSEAVPLQSTGTCTGTDTDTNRFMSDLFVIDLVLDSIN